MHKFKSRLTINHLLVLLLGVLVGVQVYISNQIATSGATLSQLEAKAVALEEENRKLLATNIEQMSLHQLAEKAKIMGFVEPTTILHIDKASAALALHE